MKYSDIIERHIYNVDFNIVRKSEFDQIHLAIVLKKNNDKRTCIVAPLTSSENGDTFNKYNLGKLSCIPKNMQQYDSFIVYNQTRAVNHTRFYALKDDNHNRIDCKINDDMFNLVVSLCSKELFGALTLEEKIKHYGTEYKIESSKLLTNIAYKILNVIKSKSEKDDFVLYQFQNRIKEILKINFNYEEYISQKDKENRICDIINYCKHNNIININKDIAIDSIIKNKSIEENPKNILTQ